MRRAVFLLAPVAPLLSLAFVWRYQRLMWSCGHWGNLWRIDREELSIAVAVDNALDSLTQSMGFSRSVATRDTQGEGTMGLHIIWRSALCLSVYWMCLPLYCSFMCSPLCYMQLHVHLRKAILLPLFVKCCIGVGQTNWHVGAGDTTSTFLQHCSMFVDGVVSYTIVLSRSTIPDRLD